jgi:hypothetical protein
VQVQTGDVAHLFLKLRIIGQFEFLDPVGLNVERCQTRCTIMRDTRRCLPSVRTVHWVACGDLVFSVVSKIPFSNFGVRVRRSRFRVGLAVSAGTPPPSNVARAAITVGREKPTCLANRVKIKAPPAPPDQDH